jgi:hypothetical protein
MTETEKIIIELENHNAEFTQSLFVAERLKRLREIVEADKTGLFEKETTIF